MSLKDLEPLQPSSPFYPPFIASGNQTPPLLNKAIRNSSLQINTAAGQQQITQAMGIPLTASIVYFVVQNIGQNSFSVPPFNPYIKFSDIDYDGTTGNMTWYVDWDTITGTNRPIALCSVYYFL